VAGLEDPNVVDLVGQDSHGAYMVVMVESRPWGIVPEQGEQLKAKMNAYATFILDGDLVRRYPETASGSIYVQLDCVSDPPPDIIAIISHGAAQLSRRGIGFKTNVRR
jgi:hypothetical protein